MHDERELLSQEGSGASKNIVRDGGDRMVCKRREAYPMMVRERIVVTVVVLAHMCAMIGVV
jgi:hypothetical protein